MYCVKCGHNNPDGAAFCQSCGCSVIANDNQSQQKQGNAGNKQGKGGIIGLCAGLGVLITVLVVLIIMVSSGKIGSGDETTQRDGHNTLEPAVTYADNNQGEADSPSQDSNKPVSNAEKPTASSGALTPSEPSDGISVSENGALYAGTPSYEHHLYIAEPAPSEYYKLCFAGDYIFYIDTHDDGIYRCNADGTGHTRIHDIGVFPGELRSINNEIYYIGYANGFSAEMDTDANNHSTYGLHWINKNGGESRFVEKDISGSFTYWNGEIVFLEDNTIYSTPFSATENFGSNSVFMVPRGVEVSSVHRVTGSDIVMNIGSRGVYQLVAYNLYSDDYVVLFDEGALDIIGVGDTNYFIAGDRNLYSVKTDGTSLKTLATKVDEFVLCGDYIFYTDFEKRDMYRINTDGTDKKMVVQYLFCKGLAVNDDKVYFNSHKDNHAIYYVTKNCKNLKLVFRNNDKASDISDFLEDGIEYFG